MGVTSDRSRPANCALGQPASRTLRSIGSAEPQIAAALSVFAVTCRYSTMPRAGPPGTLQEQPVPSGAAEYNSQVFSGVAQKPPSETSG